MQKLEKITKLLKLFNNHKKISTLGTSCKINNMGEKAFFFSERKKGELKMNIDEERNYKKLNMKSKLEISTGVNKIINTVILGIGGANS